jgi:hypothetical protein
MRDRSTTVKRWGGGSGKTRISRAFLAFGLESIAYFIAKWLTRKGEL